MKLSRFIKLTYGKSDVGVSAWVFVALEDVALVAVARVLLRHRHESQLWLREGGGREGGREREEGARERERERERRERDTGRHTDRRREEGGRGRGGGGGRGGQRESREGGREGEREAAVAGRRRGRQMKRDGVYDLSPQTPLIFTSQTLQGVELRG